MSFWTDCPVWITLFYLNISVNLSAWLLTWARSRLLQSAVLSAAGQSWNRPRSSPANLSSYISHWGKCWQKMEEKNNGLLPVVEIPPPSVHHDDQEICIGKTIPSCFCRDNIISNSERLSYLHPIIFLSFNEKNALTSSSMEAWENVLVFQCTTSSLGINIWFKTNQCRCSSVLLRPSPSLFKLRGESPNLPLAPHPGQQGPFLWIVKIQRWHHKLWCVNLKCAI